MINVGTINEEKDPELMNVVVSVGGNVPGVSLSLRIHFPGELFMSACRNCQDECKIHPRNEFIE